MRYDAMRCAGVPRDTCGTDAGSEATRPALPHHPPCPSERLADRADWEKAWKEQQATSSKQQTTRLAQHTKGRKEQTETDRQTDRQRRREDNPRKIMKKRRALRMFSGSSSSSRSSRSSRSRSSSTTTSTSSEKTSGGDRSMTSVHQTRIVPRFRDSTRARATPTHLALELLLEAVQLVGCRLVEVAEAALCLAHLLPTRCGCQALVGHGFHHN